MPCRRCRSRSGKGSPGSSPEDARDFTPTSYHCGMRVAKRCDISCCVCTYNMCIYVCIAYMCVCITKSCKRGNTRTMVAKSNSIFLICTRNRSRRRRRRRRRRKREEGRAKKNQTGTEGLSRLLVSCPRDYRRQSSIVTMMLH